jgi:hypothetical protein
MMLKASNLSSSISDEEVKADPSSVVELLPCPFCAHYPHAQKFVYEGSEAYQICCNNTACKISVALNSSDTIPKLEDVAHRWNTRLGRSGKPQRVRVEVVEE